MLLKVLSYLSLIFFTSFMYILYVNPELALLYFWNLLIPIVPVILFVSVGTWRNICPLALLYQIPQLVGVSKMLSYPSFLRKWSFYIAMSALFILISSRKFILNDDPNALFILLVMVIITVLVFGFIFAGKSGWCTSICPIYPIERLYGQKPLIDIKNCFIKSNDHCEKCTTRCFDKVKTNDYLYDANFKKSDNRIKDDRKLFSGAFPGFVVGFFLIDNYPINNIFEIYFYLFLFSFSSYLLFIIITKILHSKYEDSIIGVFSLMAINAYYYFSIPNSINNLIPNYIYTNQITVLFYAIIVVLSSVWIRKILIKKK